MFGTEQNIFSVKMGQRKTQRCKNIEDHMLMLKVKSMIKIKSIEL